MSTHERGGIVTGWLIKIVLVLALTGVALFEAGSVIFAGFQASNAATNAANEAVATYARAHNRDDALAEAQRLASHEGATVVSFSASVVRATDQSVVTVVAERQAKTLFIHKIGFLKRFTRSRASSTAYSV
ncbi:MAG: hypothetical protein ABR548_03280 [Actinomycetota bacterium]|nr:hypothetical protein [Actinomycetota bacterium]